METDTAISIVWRPRFSPLDPVAVSAGGGAARTLAERVLAMNDESLSKLSGVAGKDLLIFQGSCELLPWVDGVIYLGRDPRAPSLLLPTAMEPSVPVALLERAILLRQAVRPPVALFFKPPAMASVAEARPVARETLEAWLERNR